MDQELNKMPCMVIVLHYTQSLITQKYQSGVHAYALMKIKKKFKLKIQKESQQVTSNYMFIPT